MFALVLPHRHRLWVYMYDTPPSASLRHPILTNQSPETDKLLTHRWVLTQELLASPFTSGVRDYDTCHPPKGQTFYIAPITLLPRKLYCVA